MIPYPEPTWTVSQPAYEPCSALVATGSTPFILSGILVRLLQYHFASADNIIHDCLRDYRWKDDCNQAIVLPDGRSAAGIHVGMGYEFKPSSMTRPAVFVKREPVTVARVSAIQGDRTLPAVKTGAGGTYQGAEHNKRMEGRFSIICLGLNGAEADLLGEEVFYRMLYFAPIIRDDMRLGVFTVEGMSDVKDLGQDGGKSFYTVVSLFWANIIRWAIKPETPVLKRLRMVQSNFRSDN